MGWQRFLNPEQINPLDPVCWSELMAAVAERRLAAGLPRSAAVGQFSRDQIAARCRSGDVADLWSPLAADIRELAPLFYRRDALEENGSLHTTDEPTGENNVCPLVPVPATVDAWLPALFDVSTALSPFAPCARRALFNAFLALNRMHLLKLEPRTVTAGTKLETPADFARGLYPAALVFHDGEIRRDTQDLGLYGRTEFSTRWIVKADVERFGEDVRSWQIVKAVPYLVRKNSYFTGDFFCHAAIGGALHVHAVYSATRDEFAIDDIPAFDDDGKPVDVDYGLHTVEVSPVIHSVDYWLQRTLRRTIVDGFGGPGGIVAGWNALGDIAPGTVGTDFLPAETPADPETQCKGYLDGLDLTVYPSRSEALAAEFPDEDPDALYEWAFTALDFRWAIDCAFLDLGDRLDKYTPYAPPWES